MDAITSNHESSGYRQDVDSLDGAPLRDGEKLRLRFPDGAEQIVGVEVDCHNLTNSYGEIEKKISRATATIDVHGVSVHHVRLTNCAGLLAERIASKAEKP